MPDLQNITPIYQHRSFEYSKFSVNLLVFRLSKNVLLAPICSLPHTFLWISNRRSYKLL